MKQCLEPSFKRCTLVAINDVAAEREWLEALVKIVTNKPAVSWKDEDATGFENKLSDVTRRFKNLEALQKGVAASRAEGFEVQRITVTCLDDQEVY